MLFRFPHLSWLPACRRLLLLLPALALAAGLSARSLVKADVQLANNAVLAMYQDEDANMWIGTYDGLHLYNGKNTFVFRMELDNEFSLCSNIVLEIAPAEKGYLWVATSLGINKFSLRERRVVESYMQYVDVENIASDSEGNTVLFSGEDFITCYRPGRAFFEDVYIPGVRAAEIVAVWSEAPRVFCTLGRDGELVRYRLNDGEGKSLVRVSGRQLSARPVRKAFFNGGRLHFVDTSGGLWRYTYKDESLVLLSDLSQLGETGFTVSTVCSFEDEVYVGFLAGALGRVPEKGGRCELIASDYRVFCLWADCNQDILWVGTDGYGVHMYCDKEELFTTLLMEDMPQKVLKPVRAIHTDDRGNLWIGTKGDGVIRIRDYESYAGGNIPVDHLTRFDRGKGLTSNEVFSFCSSPARNVIWLGTSGPGLTYYSYGDDRMRTLPLQPGMPEIRGVHQMCEVNDSTLYLACDTDALVELTIGKGDRPVVTAMRRYRFRLERRDCNEFYALIRESDSTLLLGMRGGYGLIRFDMRTKKYVFVDMHRLQSRALGDLLCLCKSRESGLYCGASSGLILLTPEGDIRQFNRRNGIVNDMIHGVLEDAHGCIWLSTNKGLAQYSPGHDFFHNYSSSDLRVIEFCDDAYWKCPYTDRLFFGGVNGVVWIDPAAEPPSNYKPRLRFMDLELPDGTLVPLSDYTGDGHDPLPVRIAPRTTGFAVSFVAVDYLNGDNYEYSYMLEGYSDEWVELQKNNRVAFMNIPAGSYLLHVRYKSNVMDRATQVYTLPLTVLPPWYRTTAALVCYILLAAGLVWLFAALLRRHYRRQQQRVVARLEEEQREKLYEARLNFFVNISHELCTPLTLINGSCQQILECGASDGFVLRQVGFIHRNALKLKDLTCLLNELRAAGAADRPDDVELLDVTRMCNGLVQTFAEYAETHKVGYRTEVGEGMLFPSARGTLSMVLNIVLSNAFRRSETGGEVFFGVSVVQDRLRVVVSNRGEGVDLGQIEFLSDRYRLLDYLESRGKGGLSQKGDMELAICHNLAAKLGGEFRIASEGDVTTVTLSFPELEIARVTQPVLQVDMASDRQFGMPGAPAVSAVTSRDALPTMLVVCEDPDMASFLAQLFAGAYDLKVMGELGQAAEQLGTLRPQVVICSAVTLDPAMTGVIRHIRRSRHMAQVPVILLTSASRSGMKIEGLESEVDICLAFPFDIAHLRNVVGQLLRRYESLKDYGRSAYSAFDLAQGHLLHKEDKVFLDRMLEIIHGNILDTSLSTQFIADRMGMSLPNFYRRLGGVTDRTPACIIREYRLGLAEQLLVTTRLSIDEIIYKSGFSNRSTFFRGFVLRFGCTPKVYREQKVSEAMETDAGPGTEAGVEAETT